MYKPIMIFLFGLIEKAYKAIKNKVTVNSSKALTDKVVVDGKVVPVIEAIYACDNCETDRIEQVTTKHLCKYHQELVECELKHGIR